MAAPVNPLSSLAFTQPELQDITRQRKLSEMLLQQGMQGSKGQMVGNIYVPSHPLENIADAFAIYRSGKLSKEANAKEQQLAKQLRETQATEAQDILGALQGRPEVAQVIPEGQTLRDDQGNLTMGAQAGAPAVAGSQQAALAKALAGQSPFAQTMAAKLMEQQFKQPKWEKVERVDQRTGNTIAGMVDVNSAQPELTFREIGVSKPALSQKDIIDFRDRGINVGGGMTSGNAPMGGGQVVTGGQGGQVTGDAKFMPANLPTYQYDPTLSPAQNRELQGKFAEDLRKNVKNAKDAFGTIKSVSEILSSGKPSSGRGENIITGTREFFGGGGEQSKTDAQLRVLGQKLVQQVPRFEGPQSDKDVASYQAAAGDIGNPNMPIESRMAALQTLVDLNKKYYPNGDWDSIDLAGPVRTKQTFFSGSKTMSPTEFRKGLTGQDQEAFDWARKNPNDPRSTEIRNRLGF
jgi:hypothetical protein